MKGKKVSSHNMLVPVFNGEKSHGKMHNHTPWWTTEMLNMALNWLSIYICLNFGIFLGQQQKKKKKKLTQWYPLAQFQVPGLNPTDLKNLLKQWGGNLYFITSAILLSCWPHSGCNNCCPNFPKRIQPKAIKQQKIRRGNYFIMWVLATIPLLLSGQC